MSRASLLAPLLILASSSAQSITILPLGDSITFGCGTDGLPSGSADCAADAGGYRVPLLWSLTQAN